MTVDKSVNDLPESSTITANDVFLIEGDGALEAQQISADLFMQYVLNGLNDSVKILLNPVGEGIPRFYDLDASVSYTPFPIGNNNSLPISVIYTISNDTINVDEGTGVITIHKKGIYWITTSIGMRFTGSGHSKCKCRIGESDGDITKILPFLFFNVRTLNSPAVELMCQKTDFVYYKPVSGDEILHYDYTGDNLSVVWPALNSTEYDLSTNFISITKLK